MDQRNPYIKTKTTKTTKVTGNNKGVQKNREQQGIQKKCHSTAQNVLECSSDSYSRAYSDKRKNANMDQWNMDQWKTVHSHRSIWWKESSKAEQAPLGLYRWLWLWMPRCRRNGLIDLQLGGKKVKVPEIPSWDICDIFFNMNHVFPKKTLKPAGIT